MAKGSKSSKKCKVCGKSFFCQKSKLEERKFCSQACTGVFNSKRATRIETKCEMCGTHISYLKSRGVAKKFCSNKCRGLNIRLETAVKKEEKNKHTLKNILHMAEKNNKQEDDTPMTTKAKIVCLFCEKAVTVDKRRGRHSNFCSPKCCEIYRVTKNIAVRDLDRLREKRLLDIEQKRSSIGLETPQDIELYSKKAETKKEKPSTKEVPPPKKEIKCSAIKRNSLRWGLIGVATFLIGAIWGVLLAQSTGVIEATLSLPFVLITFASEISNVPMVWVSILVVATAFIFRKKQPKEIL